jgi:hypothetical protein
VTTRAALNSRTPCDHALALSWRSSLQGLLEKTLAVEQYHSGTIDKKKR